MLLGKHVLRAGDLLVNRQAGGKDLAVLQDLQQRDLADGPLHVQLEVGRDVVACDEAVVVVAGDVNRRGLDAYIVSC